MKQTLITFASVILVIIAIASGCVCVYANNQTEIQRGVERLLDERINEYVEKNKTEFVASLTPVIGLNGNWWIGDTDTGCPVTVEGQPGMSAYAIAVANGYQGSETEWLNSLRGAAGQDGVDGQTPYIGENGNWWIGNTDTGVCTKADSIGQRTFVFCNGYGDCYFNPNKFRYLVFHTKNEVGEWSSNLYLTEFLVDECLITGEPVILIINSSTHTTARWISFEISYINENELKLSCREPINIQWTYVWGAN